MVTNVGNRCIEGFLCLNDEHMVIAAGVLTVGNSQVHVDTEAAAASDDLDTISFIAGTARMGAILILRAEDGTHTVVVKDSTGNIQLAGADFSLDTLKDRLMLQWGGANWVEISRSNNG